MARARLCAAGINRGVAPVEELDDFAGSAPLVAVERDTNPAREAPGPGVVATAGAKAYGSLQHPARSVTGEWHVDETYIKVRGQWMYVARAQM